jgi:hypothetical protein
MSSKQGHTSVMFHMTSFSSALRIMKDGFDPSKARTKAFGHGINVSADLMEVLRYAPDNDACIIVCIVRYTRAMPNESDCTQMIHEVYDDGSEVFYTKPKYMYPPEGYDALCYDDIYIFPSSEQVVPFFIIRCPNLLKN